MTDSSTASVSEVRPDSHPIITWKAERGFIGTGTDANGAVIASIMCREPGCYMARVYNERETFEEQEAAAAWCEKRARELAVSDVWPKYEAARNAIFALEQALGEAGTPLRLEAYRVRCELGYVGDHIRRVHGGPR